MATHRNARTKCNKKEILGLSLLAFRKMDHRLHGTGRDFSCQPKEMFHQVSFICPRVYAEGCYFPKCPRSNHHRPSHRTEMMLRSEGMQRSPCQGFHARHVPSLPRKFQLSPWSLLETPWRKPSKEYRYAKHCAFGRRLNRSPLHKMSKKQYPHHHPHGRRRSCDSAMQYLQSPTQVSAANRSKKAHHAASGSA